MVWCPEQLLRNVLAHVHYLPSVWRGHAHSSVVRDQFELFFQLKIVRFKSSFSTLSDQI